MEKQYFEAIEKLAAAAFNNKEIPVGAVLVKDEKIIGRGQNEQHASQKNERHAEFNAIEDAINNVGKHGIRGGTMYVTLEPCLFCFGLIVDVGLKKIVYLLDSPKYGFFNKVNLIEFKGKTEIIKAPYPSPSKELLKKFFEDKR